MPEDDISTTSTETSTTTAADPATSGLGAGDAASPQTADTSVINGKTPAEPVPQGPKVNGVVDTGSSIAAREDAGIENPYKPDAPADKKVIVEQVPAPGHPLLHPTGPSPGTRAFKVLTAPHPSVDTPSKLQALENFLAMMEQIPAQIENDSKSIAMHVKDYYRRLET